MTDHFKHAFSTDSVKKIENELISNGTESFLLMMRAAYAACQYLLSVSADDIIIFCGKGNNGGDGYGLAALLHLSNRKIRVIQIEAPKTPEANQALTLCQNLGIKVGGYFEFEQVGTWYVDALLGSGLVEAPRAKYENVIKFLLSERNKGKSVLSLDMPSGLNASTGQGYGLVVNASQTITFLAMKQGILTGEAVDFVGELIFNNLGENETKIKPDAHILEKTNCDFGHIKPSAHKGTRGSVLVVGGMKGMEGAGILASLAALKSGAGKVFWCTDNQNVERPSEIIVVEPATKKIMDLIKSCQVCVLGPGMNLDFESLAELIWYSNIPLVLDAGGLRWLASKKPSKREANFICTPHLGEANDLVDDTKMDRFELLSTLQKKFDGDWVLKGAGTLIYEEKKVWINKLNMPQLATAGSGDVLAGCISGVWSAGSKSPARTGVWLHSHYAHNAEREKVYPFLTASDLLT